MEVIVERPLVISSNFEVLRTHIVIPRRHKNDITVAERITEIKLLEIFDLVSDLQKRETRVSTNDYAASIFSSVHHMGTSIVTLWGSACCIIRDSESIYTIAHTPCECAR